MDTMKIYEGAVGNIKLVMDIVGAVIEVCTPSPLLPINVFTFSVP